MNKIQYLFVCGCPRSGTTALWKILAGHPKIALGCERFIDSVLPEFCLTKESFQSNVFFDFNDHRKQIREYYSDLESRYKSCTVLGDKIPHLYIHYDKLAKTFEGCAIIYIYRNVIDVAQSYQNRYNVKSDNWSKDYLTGVKEWNVSLGRTFQALQKNISIHCIKYETLYGHNGNFSFSEIFEKLSIEPDLEFDNSYTEQLNINKAKEAIRTVTLTSNQKSEILREANTKLYNKLHEY